MQNARPANEQAGDIMRQETKAGRPDKTVITYGTFDLLHVGHVRLLRRIAELGQRVIVGCSTDEFNALKGKKTIVPYEDRVEMLLACRHVDAVFAEECWEQKPGDIAEHGADLFVMGSDWAGRFNDLTACCDVLYLPRTPDVSSTQIKQDIQAAPGVQRAGLKLVKG